MVIYFAFKYLLQKMFMIMFTHGPGIMYWCSVAHKHARRDNLSPDLLELYLSYFFANSC